ncbi:MAG: type II toxin-antitoxin system HicB family antitoxin [Gemmatimonadota bacterium]|nr:type II toxin-antitoxin system HicB family antitoxin [Gemmatimonadota bacterium]
MFVLPTDGFYRIVLIEERRAGAPNTWFAMHPDLPGCNAAAETSDAAVAALDQAREAWLAVADKHHIPIPAPLKDPFIQVQYLPDPAAYFDGQSGNAAEASLIRIQSPAAAA